MYESVKDQIKYERREGLESDIVDPNEPYKNGRKDIDDGWLQAVPWKKAEEADIWVCHRNIPTELSKEHFDKKVTVCVLHGPSEHMLLTEFMTERKTEAFHLHIRILWSYDATVVLNQHEKDIMELFDEHGRLHYIPNSIDLERYQDSNIPKWEYKHHPAICSFDVPRLEKLPASLIWSIPRIVNRIPTARLNIFSLELEPISTWRNIFCKSKQRALEALCENIQLRGNELRPFMKGADIMFNNNFSGILSRVGMECMAMGIPVVSYGGGYTKYHARIFDLDSIAEQIYRCWKDLSAEEGTLKQDTLKYANENFDRAKEVKKYVKLYEELMGKKK
ncbi:hypothetical protein AMJ44_14050 [candidate division WOR-1 bacterium DG_54_3]|uniref:Glycosyl transferase family 1 domain-containing protein n=1 Tax=candidate division WOR-1 bacterium DG_54_3 TaxID=1703775 RepID=A0A0S7XNF8_UNCSA|nr:MAG: hypothetical protein AMJ44_14050 [candidate division WOR-1 bacterium DG_54_3]